MKFKLGDFVRFVEESREGYITRIIDDATVGVTDADDFEIPVSASKITYVHGHISANKNQINNEEQAEKSAEFKDKGFFLAVADDQRAGSVVHFHFVNETSYQILASLTTEKAGKYKGEYHGILLPNSIIKIYSASLSELDVWPTFIIQAMFYTPQNSKPPEPLVIHEKFKAKDFSGHKKQVPLLKQEAWLIQLDKPELKIDAQKLKESFFKTPEEKIILEKPSKEIDLHIEKLRDDFQFLTPAEILDIQLGHFKKSLDGAIVHKLGSIVFIHGAGNGTLRHEIHKLISKNPQVKTFLDARKEKFGYGATEVILK